MAKKTEKISINTLEKLMPASGVITVELHEGVNLLVKRNISLEDMLLFVDEVVDICFTEDGEYMPEVLDFGIRRNLAVKYANCSLPENVGKQYDLLYGTWVVGAILEHIDSAQYSEICKAIEKRITHQLNTHYSVEQLQLAEISDKLNELTASTSEMFTGVDIASVLETLGTLRGMDEEKVVRALAKSINAEHEK